MVAPSSLADHVNLKAFLKAALDATVIADVEHMLSQLPIVPPSDNYDPIEFHKQWRVGHFHWIPVGRDRGNAGRIKLANHPVNPIAERLVNGMEALIELERQRELLRDPEMPPPSSPRDSVKRYFGLPPLDELPRLERSTEQKRLWEQARLLAKQLRVRLYWDKSTRTFAVRIEDDGIGQPAAQVHSTILSLGATTKADKRYLIGVFGQGGSSAYAVSAYSSVLSRRAADLLGDQRDEVGWTIIRHVIPKGRRDDYYAYLAAHPDGRVPSFPSEVADEVSHHHGTKFTHFGYDMKTGGSAIARVLYPALNHVLYNPVMPYELYAARDTADPMWGNAYRLSRLSMTSRPALDKTFPPQPVINS